MQIFRFASALLLCGGVAVAQAATVKPTSNNSTPVEPKPLVSFDVSAIDTSVNPCDNFYQYACGNWVKNHPIPADKAIWGRFGELAERDRYLLYVDLHQAAKHPTSQLQKKYGDFFASCMDTSRIDQLGAKPIEPVLTKIAALKSKAGLASLAADISLNTSASPFLNFGSEQDQKNSTEMIGGLYQGGLTLPDRSYYIDNTPRMVKIRAEYKEYVVALFKMAGDSQARAEREADAVISTETALAKGSMSRVAMRVPKNVYHRLPFSDLHTLAPDFNWTVYFHDLGAPAMAELNIGTPGFFKVMNTVIETESLANLKSYLRFQTLNSAAPWLSDNFDQLHFDFFNRTLFGQLEPAARWKRCTSLLDSDMGMAVAQDWVKQNFPPQDKASAKRLVAELRKALHETIAQEPWMTPATKKQAEIKLAAIREKIGYPNKWRSYEGLTIQRDNLIGNIDRANAFNTAYDLDKIGKPTNEQDWQMTPPTVNAYYDPSNNDINFPAGILQPPFYNAKMDPAVNFGGIGMVIGHEMTHGFDDQGSQYDAQGNLHNWWTPADRKAFDERTACFVKEYGNFSPVPGVKLNGKLTLGENTADNGGLRIAYLALQNVLAEEGHDAATKKIDGFTPDQRYFISFAQIWCNNTRPQYARVAARIDPHSPGRFRVNGTVQNFPAFAKAFSCKKGDPMVAAHPCVVW